MEHGKYPVCCRYRAHADRGVGRQRAQVAGTWKYSGRTGFADVHTSAKTSAKARPPQEKRRSAGEKRATGGKEQPAREGTQARRAGPACLDPTWPLPANPRRVLLVPAVPEKAQGGRAGKSGGGGGVGGVGGVSGLGAQRPDGARAVTCSSAPPPFSRRGTHQSLVTCSAASASEPARAARVAEPPTAEKGAERNKQAVLG
ncbi:hypothetical protein CDD83_6746 [Cordyceps sp. RAO-2017]|nr:hypothetical protein CDD83_6746 [Cordyceps sp. RAO-2017]